MANVITYGTFDLFHIGQAWLNYHDERNMNHKQTEM